MADNKGLLFVFGEIGPHSNENEFNDWYNSEHGPLRLTVPGFKTGYRCKAIDGLQPEWLALYDLTKPEVMTSDAYKALGAIASAEEKDIVSRLKMLNRRVYGMIQYLENPALQPTNLPAKYMLVVGVEFKPDVDEDIDKWYEEEHFPVFSKIPGWLRGRRYKLVSTAELAGKAEKDALPAPTYLSIHEWDNPNFMEAIKIADVYRYPWTQRVWNSVARREVRQFEMFKDFGLPKER
ncbi:hypothetical protein M422DRAFT_235497 [Sphaerobolus stellatus SS14]|uniref:EthD domain-containing protein n=1 Tax=Sphaerobolus stellatus (strain SS14) TaxID=990650 RepID=A0A0C9UUU6_SPHS4|nr:hypothetical protein M422DRAFT_235497 [Sphaerobolus stellatus SS14]